MAKIRVSLNQVTSGLIVPLLILTVVAVGFFVLRPKYRALKDLKQIAVTKENDVSLKEAQLSGIEDLIADFRQKEDELAVLDEALPAAPRIPELLANLDALTQSSGLLVANLQLTMPPALSKAEARTDIARSQRPEGNLGGTENVAIVQMDMIVKGQYTTLKTFLQNLEQTMRLTDILSFSFTPVQRETGVQEYAIKMQTYYYQPSP